MKQTIAIYFSQPGKLDKPFNDPDYYQSYCFFSQYCANYDTDIIFTRGDSYVGNMTFREGWYFANNELKHRSGPIHVDLIFLKRRDIPGNLSPNDLVINAPDLQSLASDKWLTYEKFGEFMPATYPIDNRNWKDIIDQIKSTKIVLKPRSDSGGNGIFVLDKKSVDFPALKTTVPYIAQNFIDSSHGIPGICKGYHDLRILFFNAQPALSFVRTPKTDSLLSNINQGGSSEVIPIEQVPTDILTIARAIDAELSNFPDRIYSADFLVGQDQPYLVELNSMPGFPSWNDEGREFTKQFYKNIVQVFTTAITRYRLSR